MINAITTINEGQTSYISLAFTDQNGDPLTPTAITYRIDDEASETNLLAETDVLVPASSVEIKIPPEINELVSGDSSTEIRVATIEATYGTDDAVVAEVKWCIRNLRFRT
jgi:hypothetical protein